VRALSKRQRRERGDLLLDLFEAYPLPTPRELEAATHLLIDAEDEDVRAAVLAKRDLRRQEFSDLSPEKYT
jgi:hypothetical protein